MTPSRTASRLLLPLLALGWIVPASSSAQTEKAAAEVLFSEGRKLMAQERYAEACPKLAESQRLDPGGGTLLNLALCHEKLGLTATAWSEFKEALAIAYGDDRQDRANFAKRHIDALEPELAYVTIIVPDASRLPGLEVRIDDERLGQASWDLGLPLDPGEHQVIAQAPGHERWVAPLEIVARSKQQVTIPALTPRPVAPAPVSAPVPAPARPPTAPAPAAGAGDTQRMLGYLVGGAGVAAMIVGGVFGGLAIAKDGDVDAICPEDTCNDQAAVDDSRTALTYARIADGLLFGGLAVAATGVTVVLTADDGDASVTARLVPTAPRAEIGGGLRLSF